MKMRWVQILKVGNAKLIFPINTIINYGVSSNRFETNTMIYHGVCEYPINSLNRFNGFCQILGIAHK
jgi:hypothetical protein